LQAISDLDYEPHALARALATRRARTVALLYPTLSNNLPEPQPEFISGILAATSQRKYGLLLWTAPDEEQEIVSLTQRGFIDGLILMEIRLDDPRVALLQSHHYPFTMIGHCRENDTINFVDLDFDYAVHTCVEYLAGLGHKHIAFINHAPELHEAGTGYVVRAEEAFHHAIAQWELQGISCPCVSHTQAGYDAVNALLEREPSLTAIMTSDAWITGGITRAISDRGLKIPEDISLVGIISSRVAEMTNPTLTAIDFPFYEMGRISADMLLRQLEGEEVSAQLLLRPPLTIRQSSGLCMRKIEV
jgi:DNA-binding LacI/PurR family transcriptional regulator